MASHLPDMPQNIYIYVKGQMTDEEMNWRIKQLLCFRLVILGISDHVGEVGQGVLYMLIDESLLS